MVMNRKGIMGGAPSGAKFTGDQLVGVQVVAGLEQQPHRQHRGDEGVEEQDPHPGGDRDGSDGGEGLREGVALEDGRDQDRVAHQ
jgi:hypothetical protein